MTPPQLLTSKKQDWETPAKMFESLDAVFHFDIDIAASEQNSKTNCFIDEACNALNQSWRKPEFWKAKTGAFRPDGFKSIWCNPPYKNVRRWIEKACNESAMRKITIVCLIPSRTDTKAWQETIFQFARAICFVKGRLNFDDNENPSTFPSALIVFSPFQLTDEQRQVLSSLGHLTENAQFS